MKVSAIIPVGSAEMWPRCRQSIEASIAHCGKADEFEVVPCMDLERRGVSTARNEGLARATGEWIAWVDCDDEVAPTWCDTIMREIEGIGDEDIDVICFGAAMVRADGESATVRYCDERRDVASMRYLYDILCDVGGSTWLWNKVFRRSLFDGLRFEGETQEDFRIMPRVLMRTGRVRTIPDVIYRYMRPSGSLTHAGGGARNANGILAAISDGLSDVPRAETIMPFWNEGSAVRAADCIYNSGRNRELMAFLRRNLRSIVFDPRLGMSVKAKSILAAFGASRARR